MARLSCILMHTGVSSYWVVWQVFFERYTRVLLDASPEFPIHFLKIYNSMLDVHFISSLPVVLRTACKVWTDKRPGQIVEAVR